jgi:hypothetical protein
MTATYEAVITPSVSSGHRFTRRGSPVKAVPWTRLGLGVAIIVMAAVLVLTYRGIQRSEISNRWVDHTRQTLSALIALEGAIGDLIFAADGRREILIRH